MTLRVAIVGGGLGGLACALYLREVGIRATVYEQVARLRETGAGIVVPPNMVRLLGRLGLVDGLRAKAVQLEAAWEFRRWEDGRVLFVQPMGEQCRRLYGAHCFVIHRADLLSLYQNALPADQIALDHRCTRLTRLQDSTAIEFVHSDQSTTEIVADVVIGADGIHSVVRNTIAADVEARFSGLCAFRCLVPADAVPAIARRPVQTLWLGPDRHFVHYPISSGRLINIVAITPASDWRGESWTETGAIGDLRGEFRGWDSRLHRMIDAATQTHRWALYDRSPLSSWTQGNIALLGDAAHAMLPFFAQGAAQATEDAVALAACLRGTTRVSVADALRRYQKVRQSRATQVQLMSRGRELRNHLHDGLEQRKRDAGFDEGDPLRQSAWLYGYELDEDIATVRDQVAPETG